MAYQFELDKNVAAVTSESFTIRIAIDNGTPLFSCGDILTACGIKAPKAKMFRDKAKDYQPVTFKEIKYPLMTKCGMRRIRMNFVDAETARNLVEKTLCADNIKKWLLEEVLTYGVTTEPDTHEESAAEAVEPAPPQQAARISTQCLTAFCSKLSASRRLWHRRKIRSDGGYFLRRAVFPLDFMGYIL